MNRTLACKIVGVFLLAVVLWVANEAYNVISSTNKRRAVLEYYITINDSLLAIRDSSPPRNRDLAQLALENRLRAEADNLHRKYGLLTDVHILSWGVSNVVFEVRWAGGDGKLGTQDDETEQWDLEKPHPGMSAK